jgi:hypothetical protein
MITQVNELPRFIAVQTDDEKAETIRKATAEATANRLKVTFRETRKPCATENPEAGCVPWYHFPQTGK